MGTWIKRTGSLLLCGTLIFSLTACRDRDNQREEITPPAENVVEVTNAPALAEDPVAVSEDPVAESAQEAETQVKPNDGKFRDPNQTLINYYAKWVGEFSNISGLSFENGLPMSGQTLYSAIFTELGNYGEIEYIGDGYYKVSQYTAESDNVNCWGLVKASGEVILPCEYAIIQRVSVPYAIKRENTTTDMDQCGRYLSLVKAEDKLDSGEEAYLTVGDDYYSGHETFFDLQKTKHVEGLRVEQNNSVKQIYEWEDYIVLEQKQAPAENPEGEISETCYKFYESNGTIIMEKEADKCSLGCGYMIMIDSGDSYQVYDKYENPLYNSDNPIEPVPGNGEYIKVSIDGYYSGYSLMDLEGNEILGDKSFIDILFVYGDVACVETGNGDQKIICLKNPEEEITSIYSGTGIQCLAGYVFMKYDYDPTWTLCSKKGKIREKISDKPENLCAPTGATVRVFINDGQYTVEESILPGLFTMKVGEKLGACEVFEGINILEQYGVYDQIHAVDGYLFCLNEETDMWTVFSLEYEYDSAQGQEESQSGEATPEAENIPDKIESGLLAPPT